MKNTIIKLLLYNLLVLLSYIGFIVSLKIMFNNSIVIEYHFNPNIVYIILALFGISFYAISYSLSKIIRTNVTQIFMRGLFGILASLFSLNIFSLMKGLYSIVNYKDKIFENKFFTINYKYSKYELHQFIEKYYNDISEINKRLSIRERATILGDAKTIKEAKINVETYCNYEVYSWWNKLHIISNDIMSWSTSHPYIIAGTITIVGATIAYPIYLWIKNDYDIHQVARSVSEINSEIVNMNNASNNILNSAVATTSAVSQIHKIVISIINILKEELNLGISIVDGPDLTSKDKMEVKIRLIKILEKIAKLVNKEAVEKLDKDIRDSRITFTNQEQVQD